MKLDSPPTPPTPVVGTPVHRERPVPRRPSIPDGSILVILALLAATGCSEDPAAPTQADVDEYLRGLPAWSDFSPPLPDSDVPVGDPVQTTETVDGVVYDCTTVPYSMTATPDEIATLNPNVEILWPGVLLQGSGHVGGIGSLRELPIRERAPLTISIDILTTNNTATVDRPDLASVTQAIGQLIQSAADAGHVAGSSISYRQHTSHSLEESVLHLGLSARYLSAEVKGNLDVSTSIEHNAVLVSFVQRMFTVSVVLPQTPGEFFDQSFSTERLNEQIAARRIGEDNLPTFVSSVVYGRAMLFSMSSVSSVDSLHAALEVALSQGSVGLTAAQASILRDATVSLVTVGGDEAGATAAIQSGDIASYFSVAAPLTTARPISYTVLNLGDNTIARVSETTSYNVSNCSAEPLMVTGHEYNLRIGGVTYDGSTLPCGGGFLGLEVIGVKLFLTGVEDVGGQAQSFADRQIAMGGPFLLLRGETELLDALTPNGDNELLVHLDGREGWGNIEGEIVYYPPGGAPGLVRTTAVFRYFMRTGPGLLEFQTGPLCNFKFHVNITIDEVRALYD
jgi:hypothetical protein